MSANKEPLLPIGSEQDVTWNDILEIAKINPAVFVIVAFIQEEKLSREQGLMRLVKYLHEREFELMKPLDRPQPHQ